jgi:SAM-dependent methyltransferase
MRMLDTYYAWTFDRFRGHVGRRVLDAGCGVGSLMSLVAPMVDCVVGVDLSESNLAVARERFHGMPHVRCVRRDLDESLSDLRTERFDTIAMLDVLEHVDDDVGLLRRLHEVMEIRGHLLIKVPGCRWLFGSVDEASGHFRRYTPRDLRQKVEAAGWRVLSVGYMNLAGVVPYWIKSVVLRRRTNFSRTFSARQLAGIRRAIPWLRRLDRVTGPPIGQSVILVARKEP